MSSRAPGASLTETLMPAAGRRGGHRPGAAPATVKVTMPERRAPPSWTSTPSTAPRVAAQPLGQSPTRSAMASMPERQGMVDGHAQTRGGRPPGPRTRRSARRPVGAGSGRRPPTGLALHPMPGGRSRSANAVRTKSSPVPRGPRNHLRPVAVATSQPMRLDVHRQLADALAGVEEERHPGPPARRPGLLDRIDQAPVGPDVGDGGQGDPTRLEGARPAPRGRWCRRRCSGTTSMVAPVSSHTWSSPR